MGTNKTEKETSQIEEIYNLRKKVRGLETDLYDVTERVKKLVAKNNERIEEIESLIDS